MGLRQIGCGNVNRIHLAQDTVHRGDPVNTVMERHKVQFFLCLFKTCGRVEVYPYSSLHSARQGSEWSASLPGRFTPEEVVGSRN
jgi:hypothetical protein